MTANQNKNKYSGVKQAAPHPIHPYSQKKRALCASLALLTATSPTPSKSLSLRSGDGLVPTLTLEVP
jgi:hypothetical protein